VPVTTSLLSKDGKASFIERHFAEYEALRRSHSATRQSAVTLEEARRRRTPIEWRAEDIPTPAFTGTRVLDPFPLSELRGYIDWSPLFHTWGLKGLYPRIFDHESYGAQARQIFQDAKVLLDEIIEHGLLTARGVYGFFPANAVGDDVELYSDSSRTTVSERFHFLRQQANREGNEACRSLADFTAPKDSGFADYIGAFAVTSGIGLKELCDRFRARNDDYSAIMAEAIADRLAEAFAECLHQRVRREWGYGCDEHFSNEELIHEEYRGIRPAPGYPAWPDHTEKGTIWRLLGVESSTGMRLTESFAMWPGSSVSGIYFPHPEARYFLVGKIEKDQVLDYHQRKGMTVADVERWLAPNLNYEPAQEART
jgi:5-methyltetrahydrofolate--homocysteine methyltransferase